MPFKYHRQCTVDRAQGATLRTSSSSPFFFARSRPSLLPLMHLHQKHQPPRRRHIHTQPAGHVHHGLCTYWADLVELGMADALVGLATAHPDYTLYVTGHSLGGAAVRAYVLSIGNWGLPSLLRAPCLHGGLTTHGSGTHTHTPPQISSSGRALRCGPAVPLQRLQHALQLRGAARRGCGLCAHPDGGGPRAVVPVRTRERKGHTHTE